jgi:hypothetical protein
MYELALEQAYVHPAGAYIGNKNKNLEYILVSLHETAKDSVLYYAWQMIHWSYRCLCMLNYSHV